MNRVRLSRAELEALLERAKRSAPPHVIQAYQDALDYLDALVEIPHERNIRGPEWCAIGGQSVRQVQCPICEVLPAEEVTS